MATPPPSFGTRLDLAAPCGNGTPLTKASQYLGEGVGDPVEDGWRGGEGEPQVPVVPPAGRVGGGGFQQDAKPRAFPHHLVGGAWVEVKPQGDPAGRGVPAGLGPADAVQAAGGDRMVMLCGS